MLKYLIIICLYFYINYYLLNIEKFSNNKNLKSYLNIHLNQDIYIICSGKSCDFIDNDFFNNKITIGVNQVYRKFKCNYYIRKEHFLLDDALNSIGKDSTIFVSNGDKGNLDNKNLNFINKNHKNNKNIILFDHYKNIDKNIKKINASHFEKSNNKLITTHSTVGSAIHLAYYMGAKNIILIGHDCCSINNENNFKNYHDKNIIQEKVGDINKYNKWYKNWINNIEYQTVHLKIILKNNFNVNMHSINPFVSFNMEGNIKT